MKTLEEIFVENLRRFRGDRTQAEIAERAGIPLRSYQHAEGGAIPQGPNRTAIAQALGVKESALFVDFDEFERKAIPQDVLELLERVDPRRWDDIRIAIAAYVNARKQ